MREPPRALAGTGADFTVLPVRPNAVARAVSSAALAGAVASTGGSGLVVLSWDAAAARAHVRMFAPALGVSEDPATGSAATALGAYLVAEGKLGPDGESRFVVHQGDEMGRPSRMSCAVVAADGVAISCRVAGHVVPIAQGVIAVPPGG